MFVPVFAFRRQERQDFQAKASCVKPDASDFDASPADVILLMIIMLTTIVKGEGEEKKITTHALVY